MTPLNLGEAARQLFPARQLTASEVVDLGYGKWIPRSEADPMGDKENPVAGYSEAGDLIALLAMADVQYRPGVVFAPAVGGAWCCGKFFKLVLCIYILR